MSLANLHVARSVSSSESWSTGGRNDKFSKQVIGAEKFHRYCVSLAKVHVAHSVTYINLPRISEGSKVAAQIV